MLDSAITSGGGVRVDGELGLGICHVRDGDGDDCVFEVGVSATTSVGISADELSVT